MVYSGDRRCIESMRETEKNANILDLIFERERNWRRDGSIWPFKWAQPASNIYQYLMVYDQ